MRTAGSGRMKAILGGLASSRRSAGDEPVSSAIDERHARAGGFYLGRTHGLIHRHLESVEVEADRTARWHLTIDLELPSDPEARCGDHDGECLFLFPLMFLKKAEGRTGFAVRDEHGTVIPVPNRGTGDWISAVAAAEAAKRLSEDDPDLHLPEKDLRYVLQSVAAERPYDASVILNELLHRLDPAVQRKWIDSGLDIELKMLVDHSLVWVPLRGLPGQRRLIEIGHDIELLPRPFYRWRFGSPKKRWYSFLFWRQAKRFKNPSRVLDTGSQKYGKLGFRVSFSVLGERLTQPLAWMPIELDFPTIYTRRCASYHFELVCPKGLSPRGIKVAVDRRESGGKRAQLDGGETLGTRAAHVYLPGVRSMGDLIIRATVGVGSGAVPVLWFLMGVVTAIVLWSFAAVDPTGLIDKAGSRTEVAAGLLLIVPALLGAIVIGTEGPIPHLIGGARLLLLVGGLSSAAASAVLLGPEPLDYGPVSQWTLCASVATAAAVPLATSWLLSLRMVWRRLGWLHSTRRQYAALACLVAVALLLVAALEHVGENGILRAGIATTLVLTTVPLILLASNRLPLPIDAGRYFVSLGALFAAFTCLLLGCVELRAAFDDDAKFHETAEMIAMSLLPGALVVGILLWSITWLFREREDEVHLPPAVARDLIAGKRIRELRRLRPGREQELRVMRGRTEDDAPFTAMHVDYPVTTESVGATAADWSSGLRSSVDLPGFLDGEFARYLKREPRRVDNPELAEGELKTRRLLEAHMDALCP